VSAPTHTHKVTDKASGHHWGYYPGNSPDEALDAMGRDNNGYGDFAEWCRVSGEKRSNLIVIRCSPPESDGEIYGKLAG
jgi:hypothetical protein